MTLYNIWRALQANSFCVKAGLGGYMLLILIFLICPIVGFYVLCSDILYDFYIQMMFSSSLPPIVCSRAVLCFFFIFFFFAVLWTIFCQFLSNVYFLLPLRYSLMFIGSFIQIQKRENCSA